MKGSLLIILIMIAAIFAGIQVSRLFQETNPAFEERDDSLLKIQDVEEGFGRLEDYARTEDVAGTQSLRFKIDKNDRQLDLGTQIIKQETEENTISIFEFHLEDLMDEGVVEERDIPIGERGKLVKIPMQEEEGLSTFYILFYKDKNFVVLSLSYAKAEDEKQFLNIAKDIESRLD